MKPYFVFIDSFGDAEIKQSVIDLEPYEAKAHADRWNKVNEAHGYEECGYWYAITTEDEHREFLRQSKEY